MKKELLSFLIALLFVFGILMFSNNVYNYGKASLLDITEREQIKSDLEKVVDYINSNSENRILIIEWSK
jgi:hypothetical protein